MHGVFTLALALSALAIVSVYLGYKCIGIHILYNTVESDYNDSSNSVLI